MAFFNRPIMVRTQIRGTQAGAQNRGFGDVSSLTQATVTVALLCSASNFLLLLT